MCISLFDAHCDTASLIFKEKKELYKNNCHTDLKRGLDYKNYAQFFAIWDTEKYAGGRPLYESFLAQYRYFLNQTEKNRGRFELCRTADDALKANANGKAAGFISVEGAELLDCSPEKLIKAYEMGVRAVTLTWNNENILACGCGASNSKGLTKPGREFVRKAHELGMLVDVSHINEAGFWDVCEISGGPVIASHSNSRAVCNNKRNLTDEQFKAIIAASGFAGIALYTPFLTDSDSSGISDILRHIERFLSLGGEKCIGIGADFDGCDILPVGINGIHGMEKLYDAMLRVNYKEDLVRDIFYNNLMRVVGAVCAM